MATLNNGGNGATILAAYIGDLEFYGEFRSSAEKRSGFIDQFNTGTGETTRVADYGKEPREWFGAWRALTISGQETEAEREYLAEVEYNKREAAYEAELDRKQLAYYESRGW